MAFHLGSLGFLTSFRFQDFREKVANILEGEFGLLYFKNVAVVQMKNAGARFEVINIAIYKLLGEYRLFTVPYFFVRS